MTQLICIVCPKGCHLLVDENSDFSVSGAACAKGAEYGKIELTNPTRMITSTVIIKNAAENRLPVKTSRPIAKGDIFKVMEALEDIIVYSPINIGDVIIKNVQGTEADIVATRNL